MSDFYKLDVGCRIIKVGFRMAPISFRIFVIVYVFLRRRRSFNLEKAIRLSTDVLVCFLHVSALACVAGV